MERRSSRVMERNMRVFWAIVALLVLAGVGIPAVRMYEAKHDAEVTARAAADEARAREVEARAALERAKAAEEAAAKSAPPTTAVPPSPAEAVAAPVDSTKAESTPDLPAAPASSLNAPAVAPEASLDRAARQANDQENTTAPVNERAKEEATAVPTSADAAKTDAVKSPTAPVASEEPPAARAKDAAIAPAPSVDLASQPGASSQSPKAEAAVPAQAAPTPVAPPSPPPSAAPDAKAAEAEHAGPKMEKKSDGTMLVDDKFVVKGEGTKAHPYEVSWDMLVSAQESYDPRQGRKKLPERLMMLNDKYLRITGYIAFPMFVERPQELLSMLNQWDGCCIGVPPTPYDAVEVHLAEPVTRDQRAAVYGVVTGKFGVKPYLAGDWLVGLYLMENAEFESKGFGGT